MKIIELKKNANKATASESLGAVERAHARERAYFSKINWLEECGSNKRGITLIALVVTVIVLLILARNNDNSNNGR